MRRYDIVSGTLLMLSIIDFALAAPVLVQEKRQACVDVVHIPRDVVTVLGKRIDPLDGLELAWEQYFKSGTKASEKPAESSDAHASSSSAPPPGTDHGSTDVVQAPAPTQNPALSTMNRNPLTEPSSPSSSGSSVYSDSGNEWWYEGDGAFHGSLDTPTSSGHGLDHELTGTHAVQPPNPNPRPSKDPLSPSPGPSTEPENDVFHGQPPRTELTAPDHLDHQSSGTDSQQADVQAAIYAAKGKAKESRRISGTARDVGNAAQRELQPDERSLDPGDF